MPSCLLPLLAVLSPAAGLIEIEAVTSTDAILQVTARTVHDGALCPRCGSSSRRVHSRYTRTLTDLPCCGVPIVLTLQVRRFFCDARDCAQRTFAERLPEVAPPYARRTVRLRTALIPLAFTTGGKPGAALARPLGFGVRGTSRQTLLRLIRQTPCDVAADVAPQIVGVDNWAWKRGHRYGTVFCDLERRRPLDLLPEREAASAAVWLAAHPSIVVVSRDRGGTYADAAAQGAPHAVQVADRWHLLKNLGDALEQFLRRERVNLPTTQPNKRTSGTMSATAGAGSALIQESEETQDTAGGAVRETASTTAVVPTSARQERFAQVHARHDAGASIRAIAAEFGMARNTVRRYLRATHVPDWQRTCRRTRLDPYREYLLERWNAGCHNGSQLFREIRAQGYRGGASQVGVYVARLRQRLPARPTPAPRPLSPRDLRWLMARRQDELADDERTQLAALLRVSASVATAYDLLQRFGRMVRDRRSDELDAWLLVTATSGIAELQGFAHGIRRDRAAVEAGLTLEWSQGQVEGQITRLKLLKRQMYGRAKFDLLRQRVLYRTA